MTDRSSCFSIRLRKTARQPWIRWANEAKNKYSLAALAEPRFCEDGVVFLFGTRTLGKRPQKTVFHSM